MILALPGTPVRYPVAAPIMEIYAALDLQVLPLHMLQQIIGRVDIEVGQLIALVLVLSWSIYQLSLIITTRVSSPTLPW